MKILVTNDDGIYAEGIKTLAKALAEIADIVMIAPDRDRSAASNSLTVHYPLRLTEIKPDKFAVMGTPTDCVHLAMTGLLPDPPDLVVSGINHGANLGEDVLYSGTVAAAMEGRCFGVPALAVSLAGEKRQHFAAAATMIKRLVQHFSTLPLPQKTLLNINIPDLTLAEHSGFAITRLGSRHNAEPTLQQLDPRGRPIYWIGPPGMEQDAGAGTDFAAIREGKISITPLQIDLTHYQTFQALAEWMNHPRLRLATPT